MYYLFTYLYLFTYAFIPLYLFICLFIFIIYVFVYIYLLFLFIYLLFLYLYLLFIYYWVIYLYHIFGLGILVGMATKIRAGLSGIESGVDEIFRPSRPALEPTQPSVQLVPCLS